MKPDDLQRELARLADRLARIEAHLDLGPLPSPQEHAPTAEPSDSAPDAAPDGESGAGPDAGIEGAAPPMEPLATHLLQHRRARDAPERDDTDHARPPATPPLDEPPPPRPPTAPPSSAPPTTRHQDDAAVPAPASPRPRTSIEMMIGGNWAAWVGAGILFLAALFAIRIAIDKGWWGMLPPVGKFLLIGAAGLLVTAAGELVLRRIGRRAAIGPFGAGLAILYLDAFATFRFWNLLSQEWAFVLMGVVALGGFALTYRTRVLTIGVLSISGGFLTPVLLRGSSAHHLEVLAFLTMLLGVALGLAAAQPKPFGRLRFVALGWLGAVGLGWLLVHGQAEWMMALVFMSTWWTMVLGEALVAALRDHSRRGNIVMTLLATAGFATAGCWILSGGPPTGQDWTGIFTLMIAALASAAAFQFGPGIDGLRAFPRRAIETLAVALWIQAGILLGVAIALQFDDAGRAVGWLVVGLGAIETGRRLPSRGLDVFGLVVGGLGLLDVAFVSWWASPGLTTTIEEWGPLVVTGWSILAMSAILIAVVAAHRLHDRRPNDWRIAPIVLTALASVGWLAWWLVQARGPLVTAGWLLGAALLLAASRWSRRQRAFEIAQLVTLADAVRWTVVDLLQDRIARSWDPMATLPLANARTGLALAIAALGWWTFRILRRREREAAGAEQGDDFGFRLARQIAVLFIVGVGLLALSFDLDRIVERLAAADASVGWVIGHVRQNVLTALWSAGALLLGLLGWIAAPRDADARAAPPRLLTTASALILAVCTAKWLLVDTLLWAVNAARLGESVLLPVANVQMLTGVVLAATALLVRRRLGDLLGASGGAEVDRMRRDPTAWIPVLASIVILWALTFEVERMIDRTESLRPDLAYAPPLLRMLWWTALWSIGGFAMIVIGAWRRLEAMRGAGSVLLVGGAAAWLGYDTLAWRLAHEPFDVPVAANLQAGVGVLALVLIVAADRIRHRTATRRADAEGAPDLARAVAPRLVAPTLVALLILWLGTLEIDRLFRDDPMVRLASISVFWGIYAIALIAIGFVRRRPIARYAGLGWLAVTSVKVVAIDMSGIENIWRVASSAAIGLLLLGTSVAYARLGSTTAKGGETGDETAPPE